MRIAAVLVSLLVAGGIGCKRERTTDNNQPATKPVEETNRGDQSTTPTTSDYPPNGTAGEPAQPSTGNPPPSTPTTGENATGTGTGTTDPMGTPATGTTTDGGVNQQGTRPGVTPDAGTQGTIDQTGNDRGVEPTR